MEKQYIFEAKHTKDGWRAVWFTIRNCEPGSQFCEPGSQFDISVEPVTPEDSSKSLRGAHATRVRNHFTSTSLFSYFKVKWSFFWEFTLLHFTLKI